MKSPAGQHLHRRPLGGTWIRALHPKYLANPFGTAHTASHATRFNPGTPADPAFEILYLAEDATVALFEVQALLGSVYPGAAIVANPAGGSWRLANVDVKLQSVIDFTKQTARKSVDTSVEELTGDWRAYALGTQKELAVALPVRMCRRKYWGTAWRECETWKGSCAIRHGSLRGEPS